MNILKEVFGLAHYIRDEPLKRTVASVAFFVGLTEIELLHNLLSYADRSTQFVVPLFLMLVFSAAFFTAIRVVAACLGMLGVSSKPSWGFGIVSCWVAHGFILVRFNIGIDTMIFWDKWLTPIALIMSFIILILGLIEQRIRVVPSRNE